MRLRDLTESDLDKLGELCNIGVGRAATALSQLVQNTPIFLSVPKLQVVPLSEVPELVGGAELLVGASLVRIEGPVEGTFLILFEEESCKALLALLLQKKPEEMLIFDEIATSTLGEVANILASAFLVALSELTKESLLPSIPSTGFDMAGAILDGLLSQLGESGNEALFIQIQMTANEMNFSGHIFLIPNLETLNNLNI